MTVLLRELRDPRSYTRLLYLLLAFPIGLAEFVFLTIGISFGFGTLITLIGVPILIGMLFAWRSLAGGERWLIGRLLGVRVPPPYRPLAPDASFVSRLRTYLGDPATWKDLVYLLLRLPMGIITFTAALAVVGSGLQLLVAPLLVWLTGDWGAGNAPVISDFPGVLLLVPVGVLILLVGIPVLSGLGRLTAAFGAQLLGSNEDPELTAEVTDLRDARARVIAAGDAERRRLERDLHDGAQQRLVSLALTLRMAEQRAERGDADAADLVRRAGEEAGLALSELRDLARGIHPAILTNRGLPAALEDLAARATLPVVIVAAPSERLPDTVEAAAYFVVSECLANVGKHAQATGASVSVTTAGASLVVEVGDDGVGGADVHGSGIQGLQDRVGASGGRLQVVSPAGEGTRIHAEIPLNGGTDGAVPAAGEWRPLPRVRADAEAATVMDRRRRLLYPRLIAAASVAAILVILWALTGAPTFWPIWPLLAIALVSGLDAWLTLSLGPLRESELPSDAPDRPTAVRRLAGSRRGRADLGVFVIVNAFLIGIWLASGSDYFWPVWPLLGTGVALVAKTLTRHWSHAR
jgi:signal transduction histidine kinase